jgi:hypothetical protein
MDTPLEYATKLVQQGITAKVFQTQARDTLWFTEEYIRRVLIELYYLPTTEEYYS